MNPVVTVLSEKGWNCSGWRSKKNGVDVLQIGWPLLCYRLLFLLSIHCARHSRHSEVVVEARKKNRTNWNGLEEIGSWVGKKIKVLEMMQKKEGKGEEIEMISFAFPFFLSFYPQSVGRLVVISRIWNEVFFLPPGEIGRTDVDVVVLLYKLQCTA